MWGAKKRRIAELTARVTELAEQRHELRKELAGSRATVIRLAGRNSSLAERLELAHQAASDGALDEMGARLDRALRACVRYRADVDGQARLIRSQQGLLNHLYGLDTPAVAEGERWQQRRHDKTSGAKL
ncbi:hypothetical protein HUF15_00760 [Streptomyces samsunensis]|uniref:hypothetical protein n=1 Tax=Streptomyces malaysiensis TaxID=92644 RepID=UPI0015821515|nr:hypothetical protein [Streptomyces samsunensis]NUH35312.1 hypothetical protein [Streptomyces samsunensis]